MTETVIGPIEANKVPLLTDFLYEAIFQPINAQKVPRTILPCPEIWAYADKFGTHPGDMCRRIVGWGDGIILGSPVYSADVSSKMKAFLDRGDVVVAANPGLLKHKVGASVAAVHRTGGMTAVDTMNHFMLNKEMIVVGSTYWNMVYGREIGDVMNNDEGIANMRNLGQNMAWFLKRLD
ncbi:MAG: flavodoxin family protein [Clostridium sp.]|nr:flavodoxin family protein [Clostridium sp.]